MKSASCHFPAPHCWVMQKVRPQKKCAFFCSVYLQWACEALLMWNQWNLCEKMTKDLNCNLFWDPKWPQNWTSEAHIPHTGECTYNEHVKQYWCETSENLLRKWPKSRILTSFGIQNDPKIGPFRPILYTPLKVAQMSIQSKTDVNPEETF